MECKSLLTFLPWAPEEGGGQKVGGAPPPPYPPTPAPLEKIHALSHFSSLMGPFFLYERAIFSCYGRRFLNGDLFFPYWGTLKISAVDHAPSSHKKDTFFGENMSNKSQVYTFMYIDVGRIGGGVG